MQVSFDLNDTGNSACSLIIPKQVFNGAFAFLVDDAPAAFSITCSNDAHLMNFTQGSGNHRVKIIGEFACTPPMDQFPDINGDRVVNILDIAKLAKHFGDKLLP